MNIPTSKHQFQEQLHQLLVPMLKERGIELPSFDIVVQELDRDIRTLEMVFYIRLSSPYLPTGVRTECRVSERAIRDNVLSIDWVYVRICENVIDAVYQVMRSGAQSTKVWKDTTEDRASGEIGKISRRKQRPHPRIIRLEK